MISKLQREGERVEKGGKWGREGESGGGRGKGGEGGGKGSGRGRRREIKGLIQGFVFSSTPTFS